MACSLIRKFCLDFHLVGGSTQAISLVCPQGPSSCLCYRHCHRQVRQMCAVTKGPPAIPRSLPAHSFSLSSMNILSLLPSPLSLPSRLCSCLSSMSTCFYPFPRSSVLSPPQINLFCTSLLHSEITQVARLGMGPPKVPPPHTTLYFITLGTCLPFCLAFLGLRNSSAGRILA